MIGADGRIGIAERAGLEIPCKVPAREGSIECLSVGGLRDANPLFGVLSSTAVAGLMGRLAAKLRTRPSPTMSGPWLPDGIGATSSG